MGDILHHPSPEKEAARPRVSTRERGGDITPEGAKPQFTGVRRGVWPDSPFPTPEGASPRETGDAMSNDQPSNTVDPVAVGPTGESKTQVNPIP